MSNGRDIKMAREIAAIGRRHIAEVAAARLPGNHVWPYIRCAGLILLDGRVDPPKSQHAVPPSPGDTIYSRENTPRQRKFELSGFSLGENSGCNGALDWQDCIPPMTVIAQKLKALQAEHHIPTIREFAEYAGVNYERTRKIFQGTVRTPGADYIQAISSAFQVDSGYLADDSKPARDGPAPISQATAQAVHAREEFALALASAITGAGMTPAAFANRTGIPRDRLAVLLDGNAEPMVFELRMIDRVLGSIVGDLIQGTRPDA